MSCLSVVSVTEVFAPSRMAASTFSGSDGSILSGDADDCERRRKQPAVGEIIERRKNFSTRQVACDAEKDDSTRTRDSLQAAVGCAAKRIDHELSTFPEIG